MKNHPAVWFRQVAYGVSAALLAATATSASAWVNPLKKTLHGRSRDHL